MDYQIRRFHSISQNPIETRKLNLIWGSDGWCYIPDLKVRQKFKEDKFYREKWDGVIAMPEYIENITWTLYSHSPLVWRESASGFDYIYETKKQ
jgi:hypothetical protein